MINIKETVKTPSAALQHMVDGLEKQSKRLGFKVNMDTFGSSTKTKILGMVNKDICYGCAATCCIQNIVGKNIPSDYIKETYNRSNFLKIEYSELYDFEECIDEAIAGRLRYLFDFFGFESHYNYSYEDLFDLQNDNWKSELPKVKALIKVLKKRGL